MLRVLYYSEVGRFRVGVGLHAPNLCIHLYKLFLILQVHANHYIKANNLKQWSTEHLYCRKGTVKVYPVTLNKYAQGVTLSSKSDTMGSWECVAGIG